MFRLVRQYEAANKDGACDSRRVVYLRFVVVRVVRSDDFRDRDDDRRQRDAIEKRCDGDRSVNRTAAWSIVTARKRDSSSGRRKRIEDRKATTGSKLGRWFSNDIATVLFPHSVKVIGGEAFSSWPDARPTGAFVEARSVYRASRYFVTIGSDTSFGQRSTNHVRARARRLFRDSGADRLRLVTANCSVKLEDNVCNEES